jgi:hypothetical protein
MKLMEWLRRPWGPGQPWKFDVPGRDREALTRLEVLVALGYMNGGPGVTSWGITTIGGGPYGREGLHQDEALALMQIKSIIDGFMLATDNAEDDELAAAVLVEIARVKGEVAARALADDAVAVRS